MSDWAKVATLGKAKNLKGGLLAYACEGLPFLLEEGMEITFVPPVLRTPRTGCVTSVVPQGASAYLVTFDTIDSIELAERLQDHYCLVKEADLPEGYDQTLLDLVGFMVSTEDQGRIGRVVAIEENPAHPLLVIELDRDDAGEQSEPHIARIPLVEDFIASIDEAEQVLHLILPEGLLNL